MQDIHKLISNIEQVIVGKREAITLAVTCLIAGGHLLIEDIPGTGKTTLALALARSLSMSFARIQFTADLLPTDITGVSIYDMEQKKFQFSPGPIFNHIVLADEINRGTPRVQSGLLESMNESQVSAEGKTYSLPSPFFVVATQNPLTFAGTYPLLAAQLDRFLMKIRLGYLAPDEEIQMMRQQRLRHPLENLPAVMQAEDILRLRQRAREIFVDDTIYHYIVALVNATRHSPEVRYGTSHRGTLALFRAVQAYALVNERDHVLPDDIKKLAPIVLAHRMIQSDDHRAHEFAENFVAKILQTIPLPL